MIAAMIDLDNLPRDTPICALQILIPAGWRIVCRPTAGNRPKVVDLNARYKERDAKREA